MNLQIKPMITLRLLDASGQELRRHVFSNKLTYAMMDTWCNGWLRSGPFAVTHLYARYGLGGSQSLQAYVNPASHDLKRTVRADFLATNESQTVGGLWVPIMAAPVQASSDTAKYQSNQATFYFRIPRSLNADQFTGNFDPSTALIYAIGLAVAGDNSDRAQDRIVTVSQAYLNEDDPTTGEFKPIEIPPGGQAALDYTVPVVEKEES